MDIAFLLATELVVAAPPAAARITYALKPILNEASFILLCILLFNS